MEAEHRPDPDTLLAAIQRQEARQERGQLKIFFGMAAGVGKTYAMLEAAHAARTEGVDVVVGFAVTHGRVETEALLRELEQMPRLRIDYRGTVLEEMDLDAILMRRPRLVLVDELAHSNAPGARHARRYQDVLELLEAGIDVYTTVNVQHFESRADAVRQITGATVHETVPDSILDLADGIELIDLTPEELRKRLAEGKVYTAERSEVAARNFFRTGNLTALREMALRLTAEHVDHQLQDYMDIKHIAGPWKSAERLMVAVGPSPFSEKLIRWTRRMAYNLEAPWLAAHIETTHSLSPADQDRLSRNLALARELGGEVVTSANVGVAQGLLQLARQRNVTQLIVGKPHRAGQPRLFGRRTLVDDVIQASGDIDVYVITGDEPEGAHVTRLPLPQHIRHSPWQHYAWSSIAILLTTAANAILLSVVPWASYLVVGLTELLAVLLIAVYLGRGPALLAATVSAVSWNFLFIEPRFTLQISQAQDVILFFLYFAIAIFVGNMTARLRSQERLASSNAERTSALFALAHETATAINMDDVLRVAAAQIGGAFDAEVAFLLAQGKSLDRQPHPAGTLSIDDKAYSVAVWCFENGRIAGRFTDTLPLAGAQFQPLRTPDRTVGVLGIRTRGGAPPFGESLLLETFASQIALAIERELLDEAAEQTAMMHESERLFTTLLNSISHELRTPIATIAGASSSLLDAQTNGNVAVRVQLAQDIQDAAERLNRLVANLLDMSRLESGRLSLKLEWCDVGDVVAVSVKQLERCLSGRAVNIAKDPNLPLVRMDFVLMEQALVNLLDNACTYTPPGTPVDIALTQDSAAVSISITDHGPGIPPADMEHIFDKFFRAAGAATGGTGLGLSICRGLVEAHGGTLAAENMPGAGARFTVRLPVEGAPPPVPEANL